MNVLYLEYRLSDGEIVGFGNTFRENLPLDVAIAIDVIANGQSAAVDVANEKIDALTRQRVRKSDDERSSALRPREIEISQKISLELSATDQFIMPDRPMRDDVRSAWVEYRQTLRDLSKLNGVADMVVAWPSRPDGSDPISHLRSRI